jgi:hypothetical protein
MKYESINWKVKFNFSLRNYHEIPNLLRYQLNQAIK